MSQMELIFDKMRSASRTEIAPTAKERLENLERLRRLLLDNKEEFVTAINADFGCRSRHESLMAEIFSAVAGIKHSRKHLRKWMRPRRRSVSWVFQPARARIQYQPLGVIGIIAPWNYPIILTFEPLAAALAAGNRVMIKPSEYTPKTSALMARLLSDAFDEEQVHVVEGGAKLAAAFSRLPFDHLLFTGSTQVGRHVMRAASENLTPVTLELGGKSPAIIGEDYPLEKAVQKVVIGKLLNAGQTCIAPDYLLVPERRIDALKAAFAQIIKQHYPTIAANDDYSSIINRQHYERLQGLIEDAREHGAEVMEINPAQERFDPALRKIPPTLLLGVNNSMRVMEEEIFGPILPIVPYKSLDDAIRYVNERPRPLALYYFDDQRSNVEKLLAQTTSGGVTINDTILHVAQNDLPFGGVGPSGMGHYHGFDGFETFSKKKGVFFQTKLNSSALLYPPYGKLANAMLKFLIGR